MLKWYLICYVAMISPKIFRWKVFMYLECGNIASVILPNPKLYFFRPLLIFIIKIYN